MLGLSKIKSIFTNCHGAIFGFVILSFGFYFINKIGISYDFGQYLKNKFKQNSNIKFIGGIYNLEHLNNLRYCSSLYFHGHSVGGTNPSLLEAMASNALIVAHNNEFNKYILKEGGLYFNSNLDVKKILDSTDKSDHKDKLENAQNAIQLNYTWEKINQSYLDYFNECQIKD